MEDGGTVQLVHSIYGVLVASFSQVPNDLPIGFHFQLVLGLLGHLTLEDKHVEEALESLMVECHAHVFDYVFNDEQMLVLTSHFKSLLDVPEG